jgi:hypothetical protein
MGLILASHIEEEHRLRLFGYRVQREMTGSRGLEETREWRRLRNVEFYYLYSSTNIIWYYQIKKNEMGRACGRNGS